VDGCQAIPIALNGRFIAPLYPGDEAVVSATPRSPSPELREAAFDYRITNAATGKLLTEGDITLRFEPAPAAGAARATNGGLVPGRLDMQSVRLEDVQAGDQDSFAFCVTDD